MARMIIDFEGNITASELALISVAIHEGAFIEDMNIDTGIDTRYASDISYVDSVELTLNGDADILIDLAEELNAIDSKYSGVDFMFYQVRRER